MTRPTKIVGIERNYGVRHGAPRFFLRPPTCIVGPGEPIVLPAESRRVVAQCEVGVVIGAVAVAVPPAAVDEYVRGYTCVNDVTALDLFLDPEVGTVAKWFDSFMPTGPRVVASLPEGGARMTCHVNGELRLEGHTSRLAVGIPELVSRLSRMMTLLPGDLVMSGGPPNLPAIADGDQVAVAVEGIGELRNPVRSAVGAHA